MVFRKAVLVESLRTDVKLEWTKAKWIRRKQTAILRDFAVKRREKWAESWDKSQHSFSPSGWD
jgi:hypothetical protein